MDNINQHDWTKYREEFQTAKPFPSICIDNFLTEEFAYQLSESYPTFDEAQSTGREFRTVNEYRKVQVTEPSHFPTPVKELSEALSSESFVENMAFMSGIEQLKWDPEFDGGGMHISGKAGILDVHVDFNFSEHLQLYRRLNILIYLNKVWEKSWGGEIELWNSDVTECVQSYEPIHNRCLIFATSDYSYHGVTAITSPENVTRNSYAAYYYSEAPGDNAGALHNGLHDTIFKARPTEKMKKYVTMPIASAYEGMIDQKDKFKSGLKKKLKL